MSHLVVLRHAPTRKGREPGDTGSHLSPEGVRQARARGEQLGPFDRVMVGDLPRHVETALAMGHAFDEAVSWPSGYVPGVVDHHDQWAWEQAFVRYAELLDRSPRLRGVAEEHLAHWSRMMSALPPDGRGLVVSSGGSIEPVLALADLRADHSRWGGPFHQLEGATLTWDGQAFRVESLIRRP